MLGYLCADECKITVAHGTADEKWDGGQPQRKRRQPVGDEKVVGREWTKRIQQERTECKFATLFDLLFDYVDIPTHGIAHKPITDDDV